jgi:uncharacterized ferredoxin-like protein
LHGCGVAVSLYEEMGRVKIAEKLVLVLIAIEGGRAGIDVEDCTRKTCSDLKEGGDKRKEQCLMNSIL